MRGGYFLAEESPTKLMQQMETTSLEEVYLKLSVVQNSGRQRRSSISEKVVKTINLPSGIINVSIYFSLLLWYPSIKSYTIFTMKTGLFYFYFKPRKNESQNYFKIKTEFVCFLQLALKYTILK